MGNFSLKDLLNSQSVAEAKNSDAPVFEIRPIGIDSIEPDAKNFYSQEDIEKLADSILMAGLQQNLVVKPSKSGGYIIVSGHRRYAALSLLAQRGYEWARSVPCKVEAEQSNIDEILNRLRLIVGNAMTRKLSDYEEAQQAAELKEILLDLKKSGVEIKGRLRDIVAETMEIKPARIGRLESTMNHLIPEFMEEFKASAINLSVANALASLPEDEQQEFYQRYQAGERFTAEEVKGAKPAQEDDDDPDTAPPPTPASEDQGVDGDDPEPDPAPEPPPAPPPSQQPDDDTPPPAQAPEDQGEDDDDPEPTASLDMAKCPSCGQLFNAVDISGSLDHFDGHDRRLECPHCSAHLVISISVEWFSRIEKEDADE